METKQEYKKQECELMARCSKLKQVERVQLRMLRCYKGHFMNRLRCFSKLLSCMKASSKWLFTLKGELAETEKNYK